jgi:hypothetical protein
MNRAWTLVLGGLSLAVSMDALPQAQSKSAPGKSVEDIYIARSVRESRTSPTEFCAEARTGFLTGGGAEDQYTFRSTATRGSDGLMTNASVKPIGSLHACFGPTGEPTVWNFYAEGKLGTSTFKGRGQCVQKTNHPEEGVTSTRCFLDLSDISNPYIGGMATSNAINSYSSLGDVSLPPGYTQAGIFTLRLWKRR